MPTFPPGGGNSFRTEITYVEKPNDLFVILR